jgi:hypothetical protein
VIYFFKTYFRFAVFFCGLLLAYSQLSAQVFFSSRSEGLKYAFSAFSDDELAFAYNPSMMAKAESFASSASFIQRSFQIQGETISALFPLDRWVFSAALSVLHPNIGIDKNLNAVFEDGRFAYNLQNGDVSLGAGLARQLVRGLYVGGGLEVLGNFLLNQFYFSTVLHGGALFENRFSRFLIFRGGLTLEKPFLGSSSSSVLLSGFSSSFSASALLPSLQSEVGLSLNVAWMDPYSLSFSNAHIDSLAVGFEALKDFYLTPRFSLRIPTEERPLAMSMGLSIRIPAKTFHFEVIYALNREFGADFIGSEWKQSAGIRIRGELSRMFETKSRGIPFAEETTKFKELIAQPVASESKNIQPLDNTVRLSLNLPRDLGQSDEGLLGKSLGSFLESRLSQTKGLRLTEGAADLIITPRLQIEGESMRVTLAVNDNAQRTVLSSEYSGDYLQALEHQDQVDQLRSSVQGGNLSLIPFAEAFHLKKNRETLYELLSSAQKDIETYIFSNYLKPLNLFANLPNPELTINGLYQGRLASSGLALALKPGYYQVLAQKKGYESSRANLAMFQPRSNELLFNTNMYSVNLYPTLLVDKPAVQVSLGRETKTVLTNGSNFFEEVKSTNLSLALSGFYKIKSLPLFITNGDDRKLFLLPDYQTRFREAGFWKKSSTAKKVKIDFTPSGLSLKTRASISDMVPEGVQLSPFFVRDYELTFESVCEGDGEAYFALLFESGKKIVFTLKYRKCWVESDFEENAVENKSTGKSIWGTRLKEDETAFTMTKSDKTLTLFAGERKIYSGAAPTEGNLRVFIGLVGGQGNAETRLDVNAFGLKHL